MPLPYTPLEIPALVRQDALTGRTIETVHCECCGDEFEHDEIESGPVNACWECTMVMCPSCSHECGCSMDRVCCPEHLFFCIRCDSVYCSQCKEDEHNHSPPALESESESEEEEAITAQTVHLNNMHISSSSSSSDAEDSDKEESMPGLEYAGRGIP